MEDEISSTGELCSKGTFLDPAVLLPTLQKLSDENVTHPLANTKRRSLHTNIYFRGCTSSPKKAENSQTMIFCQRTFSYNYRKRVQKSSFRRFMFLPYRQWLMSIQETFGDRYDIDDVIERVTELRWLITIMEAGIKHIKLTEKVPINILSVILNCVRESVLNPVGK
jgi:hypothetical protein